MNMNENINGSNQIICFLSVTFQSLLQEQIGKFSKFAFKITSENIVRLFKPITNVNYNCYVSNAIT
jgi:hypothetical protein